MSDSSRGNRRGGKAISGATIAHLWLRTGFDLESLIFCFGIGGVGAVLYNVVTGSRLEPVDQTYRRLPLHRHFVPEYWAPPSVFDLASTAPSTRTAPSTD